jgi:hypothetical protein
MCLIPISPSDLVELILVVYDYDPPAGLRNVNPCEAATHHTLSKHGNHNHANLRCTADRGRPNSKTRGRDLSIIESLFLDKFLKFNKNVLEVMR